MLHFLQFLQFLLIILFCFYHLPALSALHTAPRMRRRHRALGCLLYLAVFLPLCSIATGCFRLLFPRFFLIIYMLIPISLLWHLPKNRADAARCETCLQTLTGAPVIGCVTYLLGQCGEACSLLLFLPLLTVHELRLYPVLLLAWGITCVISRAFPFGRLRKSRFWFVSVFSLCLLFLFFFLLSTAFDVAQICTS